MYKFVSCILRQPRYLFSNGRTLKPNFRCMSDKSVEPKPKDEQPPSSSAYANLSRSFHVPNKLERRILVWTGKYKTDEDIPPTVSAETMEKARNKARIKLSNYMMIATVIGCIIMVISGKRALERGESVHKMNLDWHKEMNKKNKD